MDNTTYALDREPSDPCEKGTVGCCVQHASSGPETDCEAW